MDDMLEMIKQFMAGNSGQAESFSTTSAGLAQAHNSEMEQIRLQHQLGMISAQEAARLQRESQMAMLQEEERLRRIREQEQLKFEQQKIFAEMMGKDPVTAVLFGLGKGGSLVPGSEKFGGMAPLREAQIQEGRLENALTGLTGVNGRIDIQGDRGVVGLKGAHQVARQFMQGEESGQTLLTSAYGVGDSQKGGGLSPDAFLKKIQEVTPTGIL